ncbi:MAG: TetR/AcrR family transcriptional regulator, partial [Clostridiales bacterium]|nr:TetR/AcrR family transcriptional regulator [Clostridiales bacterium]
MKKQPEITARTRQKLIDAFWELFGEKGLNQITVAGITAKAGYNRSTFYEYFEDISDLLSSEEDRLMDEMKDNFSTVDMTDLQKDILSGNSSFAAMFNIFNEQIYLLLGPNGDPSFMDRVKQELMPLLTDSFGPLTENPYIDYIIVYAHSAIIGLLQYWHDQGKNISVEEIRRLGHNLYLIPLSAPTRLFSSSYDVFILKKKRGG